MGKHIILQIVLCGCMTQVWALTDVDSQVSEVVVYSNGATVTRTAQVTLNTGDNQLRFSGLLPSLNAGQVRLSAQTPDIQIGQVKVSQVPQDDAYNTQVASLQQRIEQANRQIAALQDDVKDAELTLKFLDSLAQGYAQQAWTGSAQGQADVAGWRGAIEVLSNGGAKARQTVRDKQQQITEANIALSTLQRELAQLQGRTRAAKQIDVTVASPRALRTQLKIEYFARSASWRPQYEVRLSSADSMLAVQQKATVSQTSGEDWLNAQVTLSTSQPSAALQAPDLPSEYLNLRPPAKEAARERRFATSKLSELVELSAAAPAAAEPEVAQVSRFSVSYRLPGRIDLPSRREQSQTFDIDRQQIPVTLSSRVVPQRSQHAFLTARLTYQGSTPLYGSQMQVYVDGAYVGAAQFPTLLPGGEVDLPMGQDRRISVLVLPQGPEKDTTGFVSRQQQELTSVIFELANRGSSATEVEVYDRYPVAENKNIEVEIPRSATPPTERDVDDQPGIVVWRKTLAPDEQWRIAHQYRVSYPASQRLVQQER